MAWTDEQVEQFLMMCFLALQEVVATLQVIQTELEEAGSKRDLHQAAFDVSMEETGKVDSIKEKINEPIDWEG